MAAGISWSNPEGNSPTAGQLQSQYRPQHVDNSRLWAALIELKQKQQAQQQKGISDLISGIGGAVKGVQDKGEQAKLNEFMQQGMTDQSDQLMNERQQALYAGANPATQSKMNSWLSQSQIQSQKQNAQDIENQLRLARAQDITSGVGGTSASDIRKQQIIDDAVRKAAIQRGNSDLAGTGINKPLSSIDFTTPGGGAGKGVTYVDKNGNAVDEQTALQNPGLYMAQIPQPDGTTKSSPLPNYLDARSQYQQIIGSPQVSQPGGVPPQQSAPQVGEQRMINGTLAEWDGKGWTPVTATDLEQ